MSEAAVPPAYVRVLRGVLHDTVPVRRALLKIAVVTVVVAVHTHAAAVGFPVRVLPLVPPAPPTPAPTPTGGPFFRCVKGRSEISLRVHHRETAQRCAARHKPSNVGRFLLELLYFKFLPFKGLQLSLHPVHF